MRLVRVPEFRAGERRREVSPWLPRVLAFAGGPRPMASWYADVLTAPRRRAHRRRAAARRRCGATSASPRTSRSRPTAPAWFARGKCTLARAAADGSVTLHPRADPGLQARVRPGAACGSRARRRLVHTTLDAVPRRVRLQAPGAPPSARLSHARISLAAAAPAGSRSAWGEPRQAAGHLVGPQRGHRRARSPTASAILAPRRLTAGAGRRAARAAPDQARTATSTCSSTAATRRATRSA